MGLVWFGKNKQLEYLRNQKTIGHLENGVSFWMLKYEIAHKELVRVNRSCERLSKRLKRLKEMNKKEEKKSRIKCLQCMEIKHDPDIKVLYDWIVEHSKIKHGGFHYYSYAGVDESNKGTE